MDTRDMWITFAGLAIGILVVTGLLLGTTYLGYRYGKFAERRALESALVEAIEDAYSTGHYDGETKCLKEGSI